MKAFKMPPRKYFEQFGDKPVDLKPFDPKSLQTANEYLHHLNEFLNSWDIKAELFGSTPLRITGKGEFEYAVYLKSKNWYTVITALARRYKNVWTIQSDIVVLTDEYRGHSIEIIALRGHRATINKAIMDTLGADPAVLKQYEELKFKYAYARNEYYYQKTKFFCELLKQLPRAP